MSVGRAKNLPRILIEATKFLLLNEKRGIITPIYVFTYFEHAYGEMAQNTHVKDRLFFTKGSDRICVM